MRKGLTAIAGIVYLCVGHDGGGPGVFSRAFARSLARALRRAGIDPRFIIEAASAEAVRRARKGIERFDGQVVGTYITEPLLWLPRAATKELAPEEIQPQVLDRLDQRLSDYVSTFEKRVRSTSGQIRLVIGVVEPTAVFAARRLGIPAVFVGDHLWEVTFSEILKQAGIAIGQRANEALQRVSEMTKCATECVLWPSPVTPEAYYQAALACGANVRRLSGVVGTRAEDAQSSVRRNYGIDDNLPIVVFTGGALGSLSPVFDAIRRAYVTPPVGYHVILDSSPSTVFRSKQDGPLEVDRLSLGQIALAATVVFMRCGASTDTIIAARRPWVSLPESGHTQVNAIAEAARDMSLAPLLTENELRTTLVTDPREWIERELQDRAREKERSAAGEALEAIPTDSSFEWAVDAVDRYFSKPDGLSDEKDSAARSTITRAHRVNILIGVNDDGFGTSSFALRIIREIVRAWSSVVGRITVICTTEKTEGYLESKLWDGAATIVRLPGVRDHIRYISSQGAVDVSATVRESLFTYPAYRHDYMNALDGAAGSLLPSADLVLELGVPPLAAAVKAENHRRAAVGLRRLPCFTVFDHAWGLSLRYDAEETMYSGPVAGVEALLQAVEGDEASTDGVYLFPSPVAPSEYHDHWQRIRGTPPATMSGFLGGPWSTTEWMSGPSARTSAEPHAEARRIAREVLGLTEDLPAILITGSGAVDWDVVGRALIDAFSKGPAPRYYVVINNEAARACAGVELVEKRFRGREDRYVKVAAWDKNPRVVLLGTIAGDSYHVLMPAFSLIISRAGGGIVNDALAHGVPSMLVSQPHHRQVDLIRRDACARRLAAPLALADFMKNPRSHFEGAKGTLQIPAAIDMTTLAGIPHHSEVELVARLINAARTTQVTP